MPTPERPGPLLRLQVTLTPHDRTTLEQWLRQTHLPYGLHKRARAVLLAAAGVSVAEIARRVDMGRHHVYRWIRRYLAQGCEGLLDMPRHSPTRGRWAAQRREGDDGG